ncbi:polysaccharide pyruvyl transferase family protein [Streptomyces sp. NPDC058045]|uniref:polysaccharide pyruvyl transferase family protein n=1 Tax=Streptomyces sp. NPDC058045 TaxID=3346311 RepID=UPI0036E95313
MTTRGPGAKRVLLRSGKSPFTALSVEDALHRDVIATNAGNLIFSDASHKILTVPGTEVVSNGIRSRLAQAERINEEYDAFVIPLANAFRPSFEASLKRLTRLIGRLRIPVVVLGVGAQTGVGYNPARLARIEPSVREFVSAVLDRSATIGVRGEFTERYLKDMGFRDVEVIGCPSLFMNGDALRIDHGGELDRDARIAVNGSHSAFKSSALPDIVRATYARYPDLTFIGQNIGEARQLHWRDMSDPNSALGSIPTHPDHPLYRDGRVRVYLDPATWIGELGSYDFSFGSRIHGNIAALLAGVPATVLCGDSRTLELARYFEIPHRKLSAATAELDPAELYEQADFGAFNRNHKERFDRFTGFLDRNGLHNTFTHGDSGAAYEERMAGLTLPPAVRPWTETEVGGVSERINHLQSRLEELTARNDQLEQRLAKAVKAARAARPAAVVRVPARVAETDVYRKARRVVGRQLRRALQPRPAGAPVRPLRERFSEN